MRQNLILTINPGTTTIRIGLFEPQRSDVRPVLEETIELDETVMAGFATIADQLPFRAQAVRQFLDAVPGGVRLAAVAGRGGMLTPVPAGVIAVNEALADGPELVNTEPLDGGWFMKIRLRDEGELVGMMDDEAYQAMLRSLG